MNREARQIRRASRRAAHQALVAARGSVHLTAAEAVVGLKLLGETVSDAIAAASDAQVDPEEVAALTQDATELAVWARDAFRRDPPA